MSFFLPTGPFDWADGETPLPAQPQGSSGSQVVGTPTPDDAAEIDGPGGTSTIPINELAGSPHFERAEQGTIQHRLEMSFVVAKNFIVSMGRGTFLKDSFGNVTRILSSNIQRTRGKDHAELSWTEESISFDSPPDEFGIDEADLGLDLIKHPRYFWALNPAAGAGVTFGDITISSADIRSSIIRMIQTYRDAPFFPSANQINGLVHSMIMSQTKVDVNKKCYIQVEYQNPDFDATLVKADGTTPDVATPAIWPNGTAATRPPGNMPYYLVPLPVDLNNATDNITIAVAAAREIIQKLWRQEDVPYIPSFIIRYDQYFFRPVYLNPGGYIENPASVIPSYFMDPNQDGSDSVFALFSQYNPQLFGVNGKYGDAVNFTALRRADTVEYQRTWFKVSRSWVVSFIGAFDPDLYKEGSADGSGDRPQKATDFNNPT